MTTHINQSIQLFKIEIKKNKIDRCRKLREEEKRKPPGNAEFEMELEILQYGELQQTLDSQSGHAVEENKESALLLHTVFQWVLIRQLALSATKHLWPEV